MSTAIKLPTSAPATASESMAAIQVMIDSSRRESEAAAAALAAHPNVPELLARLIRARATHDAAKYTAPFSAQLAQHMTFGRDF